MKYQPPYTITPAIVNLVAEIGETIGRYTVLAEQNLTPRLRRENRIRTIQASLAIENNTLTLEQVTAVIEGKRVLGAPPRDSGGAKRLCDLRSHGGLGRRCREGSVGGS